jgi:hypothetical protein
MIALLVLGACGPQGDTTCERASDKAGQLVCSQFIDDDATWKTLTIPSKAVDKVREGKWLGPGTEDSPVDTLMVNTNVYALHSDFLTEVYGDAYPEMSQATYSQMILDPDNDEILSGELNEFLNADGSESFGFTVWDNPAQESATIQFEEVLRVYEQLSEIFFLGDLEFVPNSANQRDATEGWPGGYFPVRGVDLDITYEVYTPGEAYGTIRLYDLQELETATAAAEYGYQDILILDQAPLDIETVVSGVITGSRQGTLSHINVRSAARGTPNCFVLDPHPAFVPWDGQLVRLECTEESYSIEPATLADAEAWWTQLRPDPITLAEPNVTTTELVDLLDLDTGTATVRRTAVSTYGSKGTNLATLYQRIDSDWQLLGFVVPFHHYQAFIDTETWWVDLGDGEKEATFAETLEFWLTDSEFITDGALRRQSLGALQEAMQDAPIDPDLLLDLQASILATWGDDTTMVRFRSSSNAEDALAFSGAGLYDSTSACLADETDNDDDGPSLCDPDKSSERTLSRALGRVWASLWAMTAYEERDWYGIDQSLSKMGILVNTRSKDEQVNAVAFTGDPVKDDDRILVNAQIGSLDVVSAEPGVVPEVIRVSVSGGQVTAITREQGSSEVSGLVMTDEALTDLALLLDSLVGVYPIDETVPEGRDVLFDTEWKVLEDGRLVIKQIRPFLR